MKNEDQSCGTIYWKDVPRNKPIVDAGTHWTYQGKTIYWHGQESSEAQTALHKHNSRIKCRSPFVSLAP